MGCQGRGLGTDLGQRLSASGVSDLAPHSAWPPCLTYTMTFFFFQQGQSNEQAAVITSEPSPTCYHVSSLPPTRPKISEL